MRLIKDLNSFINIDKILEIQLCDEIVKDDKGDCHKAYIGLNLYMDLEEMPEDYFFELENMGSFFRLYDPHADFSYDFISKKNIEYFIKVCNDVLENLLKFIYSNDNNNIINDLQKLQSEFFRSMINYLVDKDIIQLKVNVEGGI